MIILTNDSSTAWLKLKAENFEPRCDNLLELELHVTVIYSQMSFHVTRNGNNKAHQRPEGRIAFSTLLSSAQLYSTQLDEDGI